MNARHNGRQQRREDYEVSAIYDDAGTPPRAEWLKRSKQRRREERQEQLRRMDARFQEFYETRPMLFLLFTVGLALLFAGIVLTISDWMPPVTPP
jgi:hypothetical protein